MCRNIIEFELISEGQIYEVTMLQSLHVCMCAVYISHNPYETKSHNSLDFDIKKCIGYMTLVSIIILTSNWIDVLKVNYILQTLCYLSKQTFILLVVMLNSIAR